MISQLSLSWIRYIQKNLILVLVIFSIFNPCLNKMIVLERFNYQTMTMPVKERYAEIIIKYKSNIAALSNFFSISPFGLILSEMSEKLLLKPEIYDKEWLDYIHAVSELTGISLSEAIVISISYEMACTSLIAQDLHGNIFMGRNLDFGSYFVMTYMTYQAEFYKGDEYLFTAVELAGYRGIINAVKKNKFALSLNLRKIETSISNIYRFYKGFYPPNYYMYKVMLKANSYEEAFKMLSEGNLTAPVYYSISGMNKNEGAILTRDFNKLDAVNKLDVDNNIWFLVITNTDLDIPESPNDFRRKPAQEKIEKIGRENVNFSNLFENVLSKFPNNNMLTTYTTMQGAQNGGYFNNTIWLP